MYQNDFGKNKRENFRLQIRRKQIDNIMAQNRKRYALQQTLEPENLQLIQKSLTKNKLIPDLPTVLPSLSQKLKYCSNMPTLQFIIMLLSNILQDDISKHDRQYIYGMCIDGVKLERIRRMSPEVEINFYQSLVACMNSFDQKVHILIQEYIIGRVRQIIDGRDLCLERLTIGYNMQNLKSSLVQTSLNTLLQFYSHEIDDHVRFLCKIKRTMQTIEWLIWWWFNQSYLQQQEVRQANEWGGIGNSERVQEFTNWENLELLLNGIFGNISQAQMWIMSISDEKVIKNLIRCFMKQISFHDEKKSEANQLACKTMVNLFKDEPLLAYELNECDIQTLLKDLGNVVDIKYLTQLLNLFLKIVETPADHNNIHFCQNVLSDNHMTQIVSNIVEILSRKEEHTDQKLMLKCLLVVVQILYAGFNAGKGDYGNFFVSAGGQRLVEKIQVKTKDKTIQAVIEDVYHYIDLCI